MIAGFPGESEADVEVLAGFLAAARLDAVGVFGYSDEEGTEGASLDGKVDPSAIDERVDRLATLVDEVSADRASERVGERTQVLVEAIAPGRHPVGKIRTPGSRDRRWYYARTSR